MAWLRFDVAYWKMSVEGRVWAHGVCQSSPLSSLTESAHPPAVCVSQTTHAATMGDVTFSDDALNAEYKKARFAAPPLRSSPPPAPLPHSRAAAAARRPPPREGTGMEG